MFKYRERKLTIKENGNFGNCFSKSSLVSFRFHSKLKFKSKRFQNELA
jgi:hypothetical protein